MSYICLILSGAALLINGLGLLGRIPAARGKASPSAFIGWAALIAGLYVAALVISKTGRSQTPSNQGSGSTRVAGPVSA
jgi:hypothetical protein